MANLTAWKSDNRKFVGKAFDYGYANRMNKLLPIVGEVSSKNVDYELTGSGGYGEMQPYDGTNLNKANQKRGFKTIVTPEEFSLSATIGRKQAQVDKMGETNKVGMRLGDTAGMTVYLHTLRMFGNAMNPRFCGGDGKPFAAMDHPVASMRDEGRRYVPDPESGVYSNLINKDLSVAALTEARTLSGRFVTPDGLPFLSEMDTLLVSPELEPTAKKMFGENSRLMPLRNPDDASNAANPVSDMSYIVVGGGKDGFSAKQWAVADRRLMKMLTLIVYINRPEVLESQLDNPLLEEFTGYVDFGVGWGDSRQIIFSSGNQ
ncbi:MAG: hypothetical protein RRY64_02410 [Oscillospiraceae bacterium]